MNAKWAFKQEENSGSDLRVDVSFTLKKKHAFLAAFGLILVLLTGFVVGYGTSDPATFGHSWGEMTCVDCIVSGNIGTGALAKTDMSTTGTWTEAEIPELSKSKISTTGTWAEADIPTLSKSKISATGTWTAAEIPTALTALTVDTTTLHVDTANDRVGIGTTSPSTILSLRKDGDLTETNIQQTITSNATHVEVPTYTLNKYFPGIVWTTTDNQPTKPKIGIWGKMKNTGTELRFGTSNNYTTGITNSAMVIDETGQVGIGTTTPGAKLEVAGQIKITGGSPGASKVLTSDAGGLASWQTPSSLPSGTSGQTLRHDGANWVANSLLFNNGTNIGIGTTSPITQLHVPGKVPSAAVGSISTGANTNPYKVYIQGRYAYVIRWNDNTLQIFDVSNPASPVSVGTTSIGAVPKSIYVQGRYAYIVNNANNLQIFDISNPASPVSVGSAGGTILDSYDIQIQGRYAYVANSSTLLQIYDVSNPASPVVVGSAGLSGNARGVYVQGRYAYIVHDDKLKIFDVSNPASPSLTGTATTNVETQDVYIQGRYAYTVSYNTSTLQIFDVSNPALPVQVSGGSITTEANPWGLYVQGRFAYVITESGKLQTFDISNPSAPVSIGSVTTGSSPRSLFVQGRYAYVTNWSSNTLQIFDLGGSYIQQLEAGGIETGTMAVRNNLQVNNDLDVKGGVHIGSGGLFSAGNVNFSRSIGIQWTNVVFGTGWSNYLSGYQTVQYKKFGDLVFIRGLANSGANAWSTYPTIFTLPAGFRPAAMLIFAQEGNSNALVRVDVFATGEVKWMAGGAGSNWLSLDGVVFSVD